MGYSVPMQCDQCDRTYYVLSDKPILLDVSWDDKEQEKFINAVASKNSPDCISTSRNTEDLKNIFFTKKFPKLNPKDLQWNFLFRSAMEMRDRIDTGTSIIDIGAGECKYKFLFPENSYVAFDFAQSGSQYDFSKLNLIADAQAIPFLDSTFDYAINFAVLEHVSDPFLAVTEMSRVLKTGGECFCIVPLVRPEHMIPYDYFRFTQFGIKEVFNRAGLQIETLKTSNGSLWTAVHYLNQIATTLPLKKYGRRSLRGVAESLLMRALIYPWILYARYSNNRYPDDFPIYFFVHAKKR